MFFCIVPRGDTGPICSAEGKVTSQIRGQYVFKVFRYRLMVGLLCEVENRTSFLLGLKFLSPLIYSSHSLLFFSKEGS